MIVILAIGNEVVTGQVPNSNGTYLARSLYEKGYKILYQEAVRDDKLIIKNAFEKALKEASIVIVTGGLGPTVDDLTRDVAAEYFNSPLHLDEKLQTDLVERFKRFVPAIANQATVPDKAIIIPNKIGSAPGLIFEEKEKALICLPGVPTEMKAMFEEGVLPYIAQKNLKSRLYSRKLNFLNIYESKIDPFLRDMKDVNVGIYPQAGLVHVILSSDDQAKVDKEFEKLKTQFLDHYYESPSGSIEEAVHYRLIELKKTLGVAESCTGGSLSARITQLPDCSKYFMGGVVAYSNDLKEFLLDVDANLMKKEGAVSQAVVEAMAKGARDNLNTDYALAVTGIAGPSGGTDEKPVGTIWCALAHPKGIKSWKLEGKSTRSLIIERAVNSLLAELYLNLYNISHV